MVCNPVLESVEYDTITGRKKEVFQMVSRSQKAASRRWIMRNYDLITLRVPIGQRAKIREYAAATGESMNGLIRRAIRELMEREKCTSVEV